MDRWNSHFSLPHRAHLCKPSPIPPLFWGTHSWFTSSTFDIELSYFMISCNEPIVGKHTCIESWHFPSHQNYESWIVGKIIEQPTPGFILKFKDYKNHMLEWFIIIFVLLTVQHFEAFSFAISFLILNIWIYMYLFISGQDLVNEGCL